MEKQTQLTEWGFRNPLSFEEIIKIDTTHCIRGEEILNDWDYM